MCKKLLIASKDDCSSPDILKDLGLDVWKPFGSPKLSFMGAPVSWYTVAKSAYKKGIFNDKDSLDELESLKQNTDDKINTTESNCCFSCLLKWLQAQLQWYHINLGANSFDLYQYCRLGCF